MAKAKKSVGFRTSAEENEKYLELGDPYPTHIEVPEGYWTITTTAGNDYNPEKYWHNKEDNEN